MRSVHVEIKGKEGKFHGITTNAESLFDGAAQAVEALIKIMAV